MIIGTSNVEIEIYEERELNEMGNEVSYMLKTETNKIGVAIFAEEILNVESDILETTVESFLDERGLIRK